jgi:hypothetical protein
MQPNGESENEPRADAVPERADNLVNRTVDRVDGFQQRFSPAAWTMGVLKKFDRMRDSERAASGRV